MNEKQKKNVPRTKKVLECVMWNMFMYGIISIGMDA